MMWIDNDPMGFSGQSWNSAQNWTSGHGVYAKKSDVLNLDDFSDAWPRFVLRSFLFLFFRIIAKVV
jgi:hypothetical protein